MTKLTPREKRYQKTYDAILNAALEIIAERGANKLSLREIARRIDYSPAGLYEYFDNKDDIIHAVCDQAEAHLLAHLKRVPLDLPIEEYLVELGSAYIQYALQNSQEFLFSFTRREPPESQGEMPDFTDPQLEYSFMVLYRAVQKAISSGMIKTHERFNEMEAAYSLWAIVHGMAMLQITALKDVPIEFSTADRTALEAFIKGLGL